MQTLTGLRASRGSGGEPYLKFDFIVEGDLVLARLWDRRLEQTILVEAARVGATRRSPGRWQKPIASRLSLDGRATIWRITPGAPRARWMPSACEQLLGFHPEVLVVVPAKDPLRGQTFAREG
jgi:hypothetical protein